MTDEQFASRRSLRDAENLSAPVVASNPQPVQIATTGVINPYAPKISHSEAVTPNIPEAPALQTTAPQEPVPQAPAPQTPALQTTEPLASVAAAPPKHEPVLAEAEEAITTEFPIFSVSPNLTLEPQTASIIIDNFQPLENSAIVISETGEMLRTGSISLPNLSTNTGEISTILDAEQVDEASALDSVTGYVSTIAPIRASGVVNSSGKIGIMPAKRAKGEGGGYTALTIAIVSITIGGLVLGAFMLGILK